MRPGTPANPPCARRKGPLRALRHGDGARIEIRTRRSPRLLDDRPDFRRARVSAAIRQRGQVRRRAGQRPVHGRGCAVGQWDARALRPGVSLRRAPALGPVRRRDGPARPGTLQMSASQCRAPDPHRPFPGPLGVPRSPGAGGACRPDEAGKRGKRHDRAWFLVLLRDGGLYAAFAAQPRFRIPRPAPLRPRIRRGAFAMIRRVPPAWLKANSTAAALALAAAVMLVPANLLPVLKLAGLSWLLLSVRRGAPHDSRRLTRIYAVLDFIGRWSMLDIFLAAFLTGLVQFGEFSTVQPRSGIVAFAAAVVLTVFATQAFDPRVLWPISEHPSPTAAPS